MNSSIRNYHLLVADPLPFFRKGLIDFAQNHPLIQTVHELAADDHILERLQIFKPDLLVWGINLNESQFSEMYQRFMTLLPSLKIAILTEDKKLVQFCVEQAFKAVKVLSKSIDLIDLNAAFYELWGEPNLHNHEISTENSEQNTHQARKNNLSKREVEVAKLLCEGLSAKQIAGKLFLSDATVNNHRAHIMRKLGVGNTAGVVRKAHQLKPAKI
jgi:DNA-binding NarL/FixJ family response regulator